MPSPELQSFLVASVRSLEDFERQQYMQVEPAAEVAYVSRTVSMFGSAADAEKGLHSFQRYCRERLGRAHGR